MVVLHIDHALREALWLGFVVVVAIAVGIFWARRISRAGGRRISRHRQ